MNTRRLVLTRMVLALILAIVVCGSAFAQTTLGRLAGTVLDTSGGVLPGASVTIINEQTSVTETTITSPAGAFLFPQLKVGNYKVTIELAGFKTGSYPGIAINVGQEYSLTAKLEIGQISETVVVTGGTPLVQTTTPEVSRTVEQKQVLQLPLAARETVNLIRLQAGVPGVATRMNTGINGGRPTWTQVTQDGINIQDNFIRTNSLDFLPNRPTSDNVAEFTITTSVQGADAAGGATAVRMVTPAGTNTFHGSVFEFNRDSALAANSFFNNKSHVPKPALKRNQFGGRLGGPIAQGKLFFFAYFEGYRQRQAGAQNNIIPANDDLLKGVFRYASTSDGQVRSVNILQAVGLGVDSSVQSIILSKIPSASNINNYDVGNSRADRILNTAGMRFNQRRLTRRDMVGTRVDYEMSQRHHFEGIFSFFRETDDRPDLDFVSTDRPVAFTSSPVKRFVGAWRWLVSSKLQNEFRAGGNLAPVKFEVDYDFPTTEYNLALSLRNPNVVFQPQGRYTNTYQFNDNASLMLGDHAIQMGASLQRLDVDPYNYAGRYPSVSFGFSAAAPSSIQLASGMFPGGISATDLSNANALLSFLSGTITSVTQRFQVKDQTSGFVAGIPNDRRFLLNNIAAYVQDSWRWKPNVTLRYGLKWEYYSPVREVNNLQFLPVLNGRSVKDAVLDPNATVSFVDGSLYKKDLNNFGPTVGFAWDPWKDGKTSIRGGYSLTFVNEESMTVPRNASNGNAGLDTTVTLSGLYATANVGVPVVASPTFKSTRTLADQMALSSSGQIWGIDPNLVQPQVHQVSIGISRELKWGFAAEARYVGTFGRDIWKGIDYNQITISDAFQQDFNRARNNGFVAQAATGSFRPAYDPTIAGSQPLTVLTQFGGGLLTNSNVINNIQTNQVAGLADYYVTQRVSGALAAFFQNPAIYSAIATLNGAWSDYNGLQVELRRQYRNGIMGQINYTWAHSRGSYTGNAQNRLEAYLDNNRPQLDEGRSVYNITHAINANFIVDFPFGKGKRWLNTSSLLDAIVGNWQVSGVVHWQSGSPLSLYSGRATFNRAGRSGNNMAVSTLTVEQIRKLLKVTKTAGGDIYWIDQSVIDPATGRAVGADNLNNTAGFTGQAFFNPTAGQVGTVMLLGFDAPRVLAIDASISKRFRIASRYGLEFRGEFFNAFNTTQFYAGDYDINSQNFGKITGTTVGPRNVQLSLRFEF